MHRAEKETLLPLGVQNDALSSGGEAGVFDVRFRVRNHEGAGKVILSLPAVNGRRLPREGVQLRPNEEEANHTAGDDAQFLCPEECRDPVLLVPWQGDVPNDAARGQKLQPRKLSRPDGICRSLPLGMGDKQQDCEAGEKKSHTR